MNKKDLWSKKNILNDAKFLWLDPIEIATKKIKSVTIYLFLGKNNLCYKEENLTVNFVIFYRHVMLFWSALGIKNFAGIY